MNTETAETITTTWMSRVWNELNADAIDELLAPDSVTHGLGEAPIKGPAEWREFHAGFTAAFSDIHIDVEDQVVSGDKVASRWSGTMVHRATGTPVTASGMFIARVGDGRFLESWNSVDFLPMLTTLGIVSEGAVEKALATP